MYKTSFLDTLKMCFGVGNTSIANLIGTSIDFVKSVSAGRRSFSLTHYQPLLKLQQALSLDTPLEELAHATHACLQDKTEALNAEIKKLEQSILRKKETLEDLEQELAPLRRGLHACQVLLAQEGLTEHEQKWIALRRRHLTSKINDRYPLKISLIKSKLAGLQAELQVLKGIRW
ncbi:hypothetical protein FNH22_03650 [Fulvivirga sp. M361]|uniref:hypothetical protein n=1 Tax=Fulvivirga sp. M361 TaxID=2594266 RepID=UPI00117B4C8B|nr:hypothetical protein [Fulvivirga sp. M361]TRX61879.1 hypothetical protein FNH22_03650 [Fulvivirga sp. M361]